MKYLKKVFKIFLGFVTFWLFYFLAVFIGSIIGFAAEENHEEGIKVFVLTNGVHTDIVMPLNNEAFDWRKKVCHIQNKKNLHEYKYIALGWGDKGFYLNTPSWSELKFSVAMGALIGWSGTAIHATYYKEMKESDKCISMIISKEEYAQLIDFVSSYFTKNKDNDFIHIPSDAVRGEHDAFYEAEGRYHLFNTCNTWTNKVLKSAGQRHCLWTVFQQGIFYQYGK